MGIVKCPLGAKLTLVENPCFTKINALSHSASPEDFQVLQDAAVSPDYAPLDTSHAQTLTYALFKSRESVS